MSLHLAVQDNLSSAQTHGLFGGGLSLAALIIFAWMVHHIHHTTKKNQQPLKRPLEAVFAAFVLGAMLLAGGGGISDAFGSGISHLGSLIA